jgi:hypothetical protein
MDWGDSLFVHLYAYAYHANMRGKKCPSANEIRHVLEDSVRMATSASSRSPPMSAIISPRSSSPSSRSLSAGFFGSSRCIATYIAEPRINDEPMIDNAPGVVPHTSLSKVSANNICMYTMFVARDDFSYCRPAASKNC